MQREQQVPPRRSPGGTCQAFGGVVFPKLSKLLNQEDALSAPCLRVNSALRRRRPRGAQECCGQA